MLTLKKCLLLQTILVFFSSSLLFSQPASLKFSGFINDYTGTLDEGEKESLENLVQSIERETSSEIAVAIIDNLGGDSIEDYANELFNGWGIGKKEKNNGVLMLVVLKERNIRIEVGYGLEPVLPDGLCGRIIRNSISPEFRKGNFYGGIHAGIQDISSAIRGKDPYPDPGLAGNKGKGAAAFFAVWHIFLIFFSYGLLRKAGIISYAALIAILAIFTFSARGIQKEEVLLFFTLIPFFFVFLMGLLSPLIFAIVAWRLKKKYKGGWKSRMPSYMKNIMAYSDSRGGFRGGGGGSFGGGSSGGGGASGSW